MTEAEKEVLFCQGLLQYKDVPFGSHKKKITTTNKQQVKM